MKPFVFSFINSITLITFGLWGYFTSETPSITALIPVIFGVALLFFIKGLKDDKKLQAHIAVVLTLLVFIGLFKPLLASLGRHDTEAVFRVLFMLASSLVALISFVNSFIQARKNNN